jgi:hypothetical protein
MQSSAACPQGGDRNRCSSFAELYWQATKDGDFLGDSVFVQDALFDFAGVAHVKISGKINRDAGFDLVEDGRLARPP